MSVFQTFLLFILISYAFSIFYRFLFLEFSGKKTIQIFTSLEIGIRVALKMANKRKCSKKYCKLKISVDNNWKNLGRCEWERKVFLFEPNIYLVLVFLYLVVEVPALFDRSRWVNLEIDWFWLELENIYSDFLLEQKV